MFAYDILLCMRAPSDQLLLSGASPLWRRTSTVSCLRVVKLTKLKWSSRIVRDWIMFLFLFLAGWLRWAMDHSRAIREERHTLLDFATKHGRCLQIHQFIVLCFSSSFHGDLLTKTKHFNRNSIYCTYHSLSVWHCSCKSSWQFCCLSTSQSKLQEQIGNLWALLAPPPWLAIDSHQPK